MTDHPAFLRAVLAAPADDTPRLVYADWLDERDDPGSAAMAEFLRLAAGPASPATDERLRVLAAGLDPDWLAVVGKSPGMVPVGVTGEVLNGRHPEMKVRVEPDPDSPDRVFVLQWWPGCGGPGGMFDDWLESADLDEYFAEAGWQIRWDEPGDRSGGS